MVWSPGNCGVEFNGPATALDASANRLTSLASNRLWLASASGGPSMTSAGTPPVGSRNTPTSGPSLIRIWRCSGADGPGGALCRSGSGVACSGWARINDADPLWAQADRGAEATAGPAGWLRIFGRALAFGPAQRCTDAAAAPAATSSSVRLVAAGGAPVVLTRAARGSCYDLAAPIPATTAPGEYSVQVKNNLHGSSWVTTSDGQKISVVRPRPAPSKRFAVKGQTGRDVAEALEAAGRAGGGTVELGASVVYRMAPSTSLYIPDRVTLTTAPGASGRGVLLWDAAAPLAPPHGQHSLTWCRGPGQQLGIWQGNLSARLAECPPLIWGNGSFTIANIHARAPAVSALVELVEPSFGAVVRDSLLEVVGFEERGRSRTYVNVSK